MSLAVSARLSFGGALRGVSGGASDGAAAALLRPKNELLRFTVPDAGVFGESLPRPDAVAICWTIAACSWLVSVATSASRAARSLRSRTSSGSAAASASAAANDSSSSAAAKAAAAFASAFR